jgi:hypothetical protein
MLFAKTSTQKVCNAVVLDRNERHIKPLPQAGNVTFGFGFQLGASSRHIVSKVVSRIIGRSSSVDE